MKLTPKPTVSIDDMAHEASRLLKLAGFVLHRPSRYTEACYYKFPGRSALLRVATHAKRKSIISGDVIEAITFRGTHLTGPTTMRLHSHKFELIIWRAIGRYMINSAEYERRKQEAEAA